MSYLDENYKNSPASNLIRLALQRWTYQSSPADNISVIVVIFENPHSGLSPSPSDVSSADSGISECRLPTIPPTCRTKRRLTCGISELLQAKKRRRLSSPSFQIPRTGDEWKAVWDRRRDGVGQFMSSSILNEINANVVNDNTDNDAEENVNKSSSENNL